MLQATLKFGIFMITHCNYAGNNFLIQYYVVASCIRTCNYDTFISLVKLLILLASYVVFISKDISLHRLLANNLAMYVK